LSVVELAVVDERLLLSELRLLLLCHPMAAAQSSISASSVMSPSHIFKLEVC
jgi:hypothetical protein